MISELFTFRRKRAPEDFIALFYQSRYNVCYIFGDASS